MIMKTKQLLITLLSLMSIAIYGQDTVYFDIKGDKVKSLSLANTYKVTISDSAAANRKIERTYYMSGKLKLEKHLLERPNRNDPKKPFSHLNGKFKKWYENGQLWMDLNYEHNSLTGEIATYWDNGQLKRHELFQRGKSIKGDCYNRDGKMIDFIAFETNPQPHDGNRAMLEFLARNLKYPVEMRKQGIQGRVILQLTIEIDGKIADVEVLRSVNSELDKAAVWVVKCLPKFIPGTEDGEFVRSYFVFPVVFRLTEEVPL
jgi:TonB family protein